MMRFYFRKNYRKSHRPAGIKHSLWQVLDRANLRLQRSCARWLERKTAHFSPLYWMGILFCFTVFTASCSIYLIASSFSGSTTKNIPLIPITKPMSPVPLRENPVGPPVMGSQTDFEKIIRFGRYIDSLGRSPTGMKIRDSLLQDRPGLLDSLAIVENYYYSQFKK